MIGLPGDPRRRARANDGPEVADDRYIHERLTRTEKGWRFAEQWAGSTSGHERAPLSRTATRRSQGHGDAPVQAYTEPSGWKSAVGPP